MASTGIIAAEVPRKASILNSSSDKKGQPHRLHHIPWPESKEGQRQWLLAQMAGAFRIFAKLGYADGSSGHISVRDPVEPDTFWINPYGVHFGLLRVSDMVRVNENGSRVGGAEMPVNIAGFIIHSILHQRRPDITAACHVHSPYGRAWSAFGKGIDMLNQDSCMFYKDLSVYASFGGVVFSAIEGQHIADALGPTHKNMILQNHGLLTCGSTVSEAAAFFIALERACQAQLLAEAASAPSTVGASTGLRKTVVGDIAAADTKGRTGSPEVMFMQFQPEYDMIMKETAGDFLQ